MMRDARRRSMLACSVGVHTIALALLFWWDSATPDLRLQRGTTVLDTISVRDSKAQPEQKADLPVVDVSVRPTTAPFLVTLPMVAQAAVSSGDQGAVCQISAAVQTDLAADDAARTEVAAIPFDQRSVASAVVLWTAAPDYVRPPLPTTEALILERLRLVAPECLDVDQTGPDFLYVTANSRTVAIAIGSGQWRWRAYFDALIATDQQQAEPPMAGAQVG